ncbi:MAG: envelope stress response membrane protein PspC [Gammaproteobacteria bacterium]|nr:envelope stress response membrane protein PspC [Gammaproteobacteria bacterium]
MSEDSVSPRRTLYRDTRNGKITGVCAGLADYFGFERWVVRIICLSLVVFMGPMPVVAYFVLTFILDKKPGHPESMTEARMREGIQKGMNGMRGAKAPANQKYQPDPLTVWRSGTAPSQVLATIEGSFSKLELRLRDLESFVTSKRFHLEREFQEIRR